MRADLLAEISDALDIRVTSHERVGGGDINDAFKVELVGGPALFVKVPPDGSSFASTMYEAEADGLAWLAETGAIAVPSVVGVGRRWLALTWVERGQPALDYDERLGRSLAQLHRFGARSFGLAYDNFIGPLPQANTALPDWPTFYAERRLLPMLVRARSNGVSMDTSRRIETLCADLANRCGDPEPAARLHGDLWAGNAFPDASGRPVLVDPAVYGGHREVDLAMMRLFGGFGERTFAAYHEAYPLAAGWRERVALYQLYPLLVHVAVFGRGYAGQLDDTLRRLV